MNKDVSKSILDKNLEIHYNEAKTKNRNGRTVPLNLQGKIKCPILNQQISSIVCSMLMDKEDWPRGIDENICKKCKCYIYISIKKFQEKKNDNIKN